jgi:TolB protein
VVIPLLGTRDARVLPQFDSFFREAFGPVARAATLVARDPGVGQELAQEAFLRLYERWSAMQSEEHARRFAYRVAINLARSHLRKHLRLVLAGLTQGLSFDVDASLTRLYRGARRRRALRRAGAVVVASAVAALGLGGAWLLRPGGREMTLGTPDAGPSGAIAYMVVTGNGTGSSLAVVEVGEQDRRPLQAAGAFAAYPIWSPDGSMVVYASGPDYGELELTVADADGSNARPLGVQTGVPLFAWSPDGSQIAYARWDEGSASQVVAIVGLDGSADRIVSRWAAVQSVAWSPDGRRLLVAGRPANEANVGGPEGFDLYSFATDGSDLVRLTRALEYEHWASWSPDGSMIVFARSPNYDDADYRSDVWVMDADGTHERRLTDWDGFDSFPVWSPDGRWIAFASDRDATPGEQASMRRGEAYGGVSIYLMRADGSDVRRLLTAGEGEVLLPTSWTA